MLVVKDLSVEYSGARALSGVSLDLPEGGVLAVLGNNGAGKTTLLRSISGILSAYQGKIVQGSISLKGTSITGSSPTDVVAAGVVQVPEGREIFSSMTVAENLQLGGFTCSRSQRRVALEFVLDMFNPLRRHLGKKAGLLSGGEQQMVALGRALMSSPQVLLLDEPSLGLAPMVTRDVGKVIRQIQERGTTVMLVEQNAAMALSIASHVAVIEVGVVTFQCPIDEVAGQNQILEGYLGTGLLEQKQTRPSTVGTRLRPWRE